jgi:two-component system nitrogen regulation response regulator GlnG
LSEETTHGELPKKKRKPADVSEEELIEALRANIWQTGHTASYLNISKTSLYKLIDSSSRIRKARSLTSEEIRPMIQSHKHNVQAMAAILEVSPRGLRLRMRELGLV